MKLRKTALAAALVGALGASAAAHAITIDGITFEEGALFEFVLLAEGERFGDMQGNDNGVIDGIGEELVGVGRVAEITDGSANVLWENGDNGRELTVYFYDYIAESFGGTNNATIGFTGGKVEIYSDTAEDFERNGDQADDIAKATGGDLWLELVGSPIGDASDPLAQFGASGAPITLRSEGIALSGATVDGRGNLDVVGGSAAAYFDTDTFNCTSDNDPDGPCPDDADKVFTSSGQLKDIVDIETGGWAFLGTGEVQDFAVPAPATLALLGLGMAGMGFRARRKTKA